MPKEKTIKISAEFHKKIMKMKYELGYNDAEDLIKSLIKIAQQIKPANKYLPYACNLGAIRTSLGITQSDLARLIGKTPEFVNMIEHQKYYPILETRIKIAKALKTDTSAIWIENKLKKGGKIK